MAEEARKKADPAGAAGGEKSAKAAGGIKALLSKTPVLLGGVMLIEAVVLFAGFKLLGGGPPPASGAELVEPAEGETTKGRPVAAGDWTEIQVVEFRAPNKVSGRLMLIDVSIYMAVKSEYQQRATDMLKAREALIADRIRTIIAQSDPERLGGEAEPGLETLRRQIKYQLDEILGEGIVEEVLVPRCIPIRAD